MGHAQFLDAPLPLIFEALEQAEEWYRKDITARSTTDAIGWANVCNRLRFSDKAPVSQVLDFLPFDKTNKDDITKNFEVPEKTKAIAKRLFEERKLPMRVEGILIQMGVVPWARENPSVDTTLQMLSTHSNLYVSRVSVSVVTVDNILE